MPPEENAPSLRDTISSAVDTAEGSGEASEVTPAPSEGTTGVVTDPTVGASPEPTKEATYLETKEVKQDEQKPVSESTEGTQKAESKQQTEEEKDQSRARVDRPPQSWKGEARQAWNALPLPVRQEVLRRERDINNQLKQYSGLREFTNQFANMVQPFLPRIQQLGTNPVVASQKLFEADRIMSTGSKGERAGFVAKLINDYDIDIATLDEVLSGRVVQDLEPSNIIRQEIQQALNPVYQMFGQLQGDRQRHEQTQQQKADDMVLQMSTDPNFPYYEELREDMADIIDLAAKRGLALTLPQAYSKAAAAHPEIGPLVVGQMQKSSLSAVNDEAQRAKAASVSIGGAPRGTPPNNTDPTNLRATLERSIAINSRR